MLRCPTRDGLRVVLAICAGGLALAASASAAAPEGALDSRGWEMVSPAEKNGGEVEAPGGESAGVLQAASSGGALAFASAASFGEAEGAAPQSQYVGHRGAVAWATVNVTPPLLAGTYAGGAYQLFSPGLERALLISGWRCRGGAASCPEENPPLAPGAPAGYRNLYLRQGGTYIPLITTANAPPLPPDPADFALSTQGATPDLARIVLGLDSGLYEWSEGTLALIDPAPGAALAASAGAISGDGSRVYFAKGGDLFLLAGQSTVQVDESIGGGGTFETASADGSVAFFTKAGHLYRYDAGAQQATDLTPGGEVQGVLGASADGAYLYYLAADGLYLHHAGVAAKIAASADAGNYPPATGTARVTPDGTRLAFASSASLTGYANAGKAELFLYDASAKKLLCASCNPKGSTPSGPSTIPGAVAAGGGPPAYKPRALSADGRRLFFDSADSLVSTDTDHNPDVYEWEAQGSGGCAKAAGCLGLISGGRVASATFLDASSDGSDVFFATLASLLPADTGATDIYDARAGGGFPEPASPIPCFGDACQGPAPGPDDPAPATTLVLGSGNSPARFAQSGKRRKHHRRHRKHRKHTHAKPTGRHGARR